MNIQKYTVVMIIMVVGFMIHCIGDGNAWAGDENIVESGNYRTIEVGLDGTFASGWHTPRWYQYRQYTINNIDYYPIGCGSTAWTIVYGYWKVFQNKQNLFDRFDVTANAEEADTNDPEVKQVMDKVAYYIETDFRWDGGGTDAKKMCQGIQYAIDKGYTHSKCWKILGTEFNKFEHVQRHLKANRPVILNMAVDDGRPSRTLTNHYVVIEKARKKQEKVNGEWRDRDVEYYINFGWGNAKDREWVSVRQRGGNTGQLTTSTNIYLINISNTPLPDEPNEEACKEWCTTNSECAMCSTKLGCGAGYANLKSFTEAGNNWHACRKRDTERSDASESNRLACEAWCKQNSACVKCDTAIGCGSGYTSIKSWTGTGTNWYACRKRAESTRDQASDANHQACQSWCDANKPTCVKCSTQSGCGSGYTSMKSWIGSGTNWHACKERPREQASRNNKEACEAWCNTNKPTCAKCSTTFGCGVDYEHLKSWTGSGTNWHACKERPRAQDSRNNKEACEAWCDANKPTCVKCDTKRWCGAGYTSMKSWTGPGTNWHACKKK